jgi:hypothetical protein
MPVYNGERFLRAAIDALLAQTFTDFEIIISDNASTDGTGDICRAYAARDARIRYFGHPVNHGSAWNHSQVLGAARGPYFTWAHADDCRAPEQLAACIAELDRAPASVAEVVTGGAIVDEHDRLMPIRIPTMDLRQERASDRLRMAIRNGPWCNVLFGVMRTEVIRACRPMGGCPYSDLPLINEMALRGQCWEIPDNLFYRRWHAPWTDDFTAVYLDPRNDGALILPICQVFIDTMRAIRAVDLPRLESMHCKAVLIREWLPGQWRGMKCELRHAVRTWLRRVRSAEGVASSDRRAGRRLSASRRAVSP